MKKIKDNSYLFPMMLMGAACGILIHVVFNVSLPISILLATGIGIIISVKIHSS